MAELTVFKSHAPVMGYVFKAGKSIHFMNGIYATAAKDEIEELTAECENGHPNFYIDPEMKTIDSTMLDPMAVLREQIRKEELAKILAARNPENDMGFSDQGSKLSGIANSRTISGAMAGSESQAQAANPTVPAGTIKIAK